MASAVFLDLNYLFFVDPKVRIRFLDEEISAISSEFINTKILIGVWNEYNVDEFVPVFQKIIDYKFKEITAIFGIGLKDRYIASFPQHLLANINTIFIDTYPIIAKIACNNTIVNTSWDSTINKGFFLTGQLARYNRIVLLEKLYNFDLLQNIEFTFPYGEKQKDSIIEFYNNTVKQIPRGFEEFFDYCKNSAANGDFGIMYDAEKYLPNLPVYKIPYLLYKNTNYSIVSETFFGPQAIISEKSYHAILNRHPFILTGPSGVVRLMKDRGYKTFENYLPYPHYDDVLDNMQRMELVAENIKAFPEIITKFSVEIRQDIEYNFNLLQSKIVDLETTLENLCLDNRLPKSIIVNSINTLIPKIATVDELANIREKEQQYLNDEK